MRHSYSFVSGWATVAALVLLPAAPARAVNQFQRILANDAAPNDGFGRSTGMSGNSAVIGAFQDTYNNLTHAGSAYIFRDGGAGNWSQLDKLLPNDPAADNMFGMSVAISGNTAIVGSPFSAGGGAAYIFHDNGAGDWIQIDRIVADNASAGDEFGTSVAIDGNTAIVGAAKRGSSTGAAYVFRDNGAGDWAQIGALSANDGETGDQFGGAVAISGTRALIGSPFYADPPMNTGAVYVFEDAGGATGWSQADKLLPANPMLPQQFGQFGSAVALSGTTAAIGAIRDATATSSAGAAYIFQRNASSVWEQQDKLLPSDPANAGQFGISVGLSGNTAVVGANQSAVNGHVTGSAYLYRNNGAGAWNQISRLTASDGEAGDFFGFSSAISGTTALVGVVLDNDINAGVDSGSGYLYHVPGAVLAGDYNLNGKVDGADYTLWRNLSGQTGAGLAADGNGDNVVNRADYNLWKRNFGRTTATGSLVAASTVPEPGSMWLSSFALAWLALTFLRRSR